MYVQPRRSSSSMSANIRYQVVSHLYRSASSACPRHTESSVGQSVITAFSSFLFGKIIRNSLLLTSVVVTLVPQLLSVRACLPDNLCMSVSGFLLCVYVCVRCTGCLITRIGSPWSVASSEAGVGLHCFEPDSGYHLIQGQLLIHLPYTLPLLINELI